MSGFYAPRHERSSRRVSYAAVVPHTQSPMASESWSVPTLDSTVTSMSLVKHQENRQVQLQAIGIGSSTKRWWNGCHAINCMGQVFEDTEYCLLHHFENDVWTNLRERIYSMIMEKAARYIPLNGIHLTEPFWNEIRELIRRVNRRIGVPGGDTISVGLAAQAIRAPFILDLSALTFESEVVFLGARFDAGFRALRSEFQRLVDFSFVTSSVNTSYFQDCSFAGDVRLENSCVLDHLAFVRGRVAGNIYARHIQGGMYVEGPVEGNCELMDACLKTCSFQRAVIEGDIRLNNLHADEIVALNLQTGSRRFGPATVTTQVRLERAIFTRRVEFDVTAKTVDMHDATFDGGGTLTITGGAKVDLRGLSPAAPLLISGVDGTTSITMMDQADLRLVTLSSILLDTCEMYGAYGLQSLQLDPTVKFAYPPKYRTKRQCIYDEYLWRSARGGRKGRVWKKSSPLPPVLEEGDVKHRPALTASQVATVYRSLRHGREGQSDQPGAADFYYGEMEMRRRSELSPFAERAILFIYWLISGYALRASRALFGLGLVFLIGALLMHEYGISAHHPTWRESGLASAQSLIPSVNVDAKLSTGGSFLEIVLTLIGPVLLGLAALALRNRARR
jgi:hypothetical protein